MISYYHKLIYLLPLALITGPFLPDLIVVICSILFLIDTFRLKLFNYYNNNFFKIFIIFFILINLSSLFSEHLKSLKYSIGYIRYGVFSIFLYYVLVNFKNFKLNFSLTFFFTFIIIIFDGYIQYFFGKNLFLMELQTYTYVLPGADSGLPYVTSFMGEEKKLGSFLARLLPIFLFSIFIIKEKFNFRLPYYSSALMIILFILILLTTERVSIFVATCLFILILFKSSFLINSKKLFFFGIIILTALTLFYNPSLYEKIKSVFYSSGLLFPGYTESGSIKGGYDEGIFFFSKFHQDQIINVIRIFKENSLFGVGAKNYKLYVSNGWHPHNYHAQVIAELGMFSYLVFFSTFFFLLIKSIKIFLFEKFANIEAESTGYIYIILLLNLLPIPSGDFFNNWVNIILYLPIGFLLYLNEKKI